MPALEQALGRWFDAHARDLPWRRTRDPYAIWVSEIMLQQTRVETVVPYYERFIARFPDVSALARASCDDVLASWSGLGYYRRARSLWLAARELQMRRGGELPRTASELRLLQGVGAYTAGAIASIAFDLREPVVDGNVARVLARLCRIDDDVASSAGRRRLWELARSLVPVGRPGRFNQALMELGATVCTPERPACERCPVRARCQARAAGRVHELPVVGARCRPRTVSLVAAVVYAGADRGAMWLGQRRPGGLYGGLWEPPMVEAVDLGAARGALAAYGIARRLRLGPVGEVEHLLTHRRLRLTVVVGRVRRAFAAEPCASYACLAWHPRAEPPRAMSKLARRVLAVATQEGGG